jgi:membrane protein required for beta-lactamase induction
MDRFPRPRKDEVPPSTESNIAKISMSGDTAGLIVTLVMLAIFLTLAEARWFLAASVPVGVAVAVLCDGRRKIADD